MLKDKAYYLYRIDLTKKVRNQLRSENVLLEEQVESQKMLYDEINDEIAHVNEEMNLVKKLILHETIALEDVKSTFARLDFISKNRKDQIDDLREQLELRMKIKKGRDEKISLLENLKKERAKLRSYYKNENSKIPNKQVKSKASKKLDDIAEIISARKNELKDELDQLKKKLDL